jgi:membrane protein
VRSFKNFFVLLKNAGVDFFMGYGLKYSAALAYYTIFSVGPLVLIIISITGIFFGKDAVEGHIYDEINKVVGKDAALQVQATIKSISLSGKSVVATTIGVIALLIGASGIFAEVQDSINSIWGFKSKPSNGILKLLLNRMLSFSMIAIVGFILMVSLVLNAAIDGLSNVIASHFPQVAVLTLLILNNIITFVAITILFAIIFKVLPDAQIKWREVREGAVITSLLFMAGKFLIGFYLGQSHVATSFGAASSIILMMVWVYYNSIILYFGAQFTQSYVRSKGTIIHPNDYAVAVESRTIELNDSKQVQTKNDGDERRNYTTTLRKVE